MLKKWSGLRTIKKWNKENSIKNYWVQKVEVYLVATSFLRGSEKRKELNEKCKQLEETRHDKPQEKEVATTGLVMSGMTDKLKLIYKVISTLPWMVHTKDF